MAATTDYFSKAKRKWSTTVGAGGILAGGATLPLSSVSGLPTDTPIVVIVNPGGATEEVMKGVISGSNLTTVSKGLSGTTDSGHDPGEAVVIYLTEKQWNDLVDGILVDHDGDGSHQTLTDTNGNEWIKQSVAASAVNEFTIGNAATGNAPELSATGGDTNIGIKITPKGTGNVEITKRFDGWVTGLTAPTTVTYNGNNNYSLVFNSLDLSGLLSPGMRLRATRTVTAPTQCTDLEAGSSQYYNKTSPSGMTFTDDFVVSAWVKLESYGAAMTIASRYNGTSGWDVGVLSDGRIYANGYNAGAANVSGISTYTSIPLNKWTHVAVQLDMSSFTATTTTSYVMVDGVDVLSTVARAGTNPTALVQAGNLEIGGRNGGLQPFDGKLAQVAIYSAKVAQATIQASMSQTLSGSETSLISAYSFNNSITDLNANANNLTAQGSAVATNVDSPFAGGANAKGGYTAGTTEFGEVTDVTFSTNTTVTVRTPDNYLIPTSGGVSALAYSTQQFPLGWQGMSRIIGYAQLCVSWTANTGAGGITSYTDISGLTTTITARSGRPIRIRLWAQAVESSAGAPPLYSLAIRESSTVIADAQNGDGGASTRGYLSTETILYPTTGSHTYKASFATNQASPTCVVFAATTSPAFISVEELY